LSYHFGEVTSDPRGSLIKREGTDYRAGELPRPGFTDVAQRGDPDKMQSMDKTLTADDILPLVASLAPQERLRLLRLIALSNAADAPLYQSIPPSRDEFSADEDSLAWDADGWEDVG
jgi:hypothetical protein